MVLKKNNLYYRLRRFDHNVSKMSWKVVLGDFFCWKVRWSYFSKGSMWLVCLIVLNGVGHKNWRVRNSTMYRTVQRNFDLQPFTLKTKRLLRHITRWCTSHKVTMIIRYILRERKMLFHITQFVKRTKVHSSK